MEAPTTLTPIGTPIQAPQIISRASWRS
jgi:hypothetical protein